MERTKFERFLFEKNIKIKELYEANLEVNDYPLLRSYLSKIKKPENYNIHAVSIEKVKKAIDYILEQRGEKPCRYDDIIGLESVN